MEHPDIVPEIERSHGAAVAGSDGPDQGSVRPPVERIDCGGRCSRASGAVAHDPLPTNGVVCGVITSKQPFRSFFFSRKNGFVGCQIVSSRTAAKKQSA